MVKQKMTARVSHRNVFFSGKIDPDTLFVLEPTSPLLESMSSKSRVSVMEQMIAAATGRHSCATLLDLFILGLHIKYTSVDECYIQLLKEKLKSYRDGGGMVQTLESFVSS